MVRGGTGSAALIALSLAGVGVAGAQDRGTLPPQEKYGLRLQYREFRPTVTGDAAKASGGTEGSTVDVTKDLVARLEELLGPGTTVIDHAGRA